MLGHGLIGRAVVAQAMQSASEIMVVTRSPVQDPAPGVGYSAFDCLDDTLCDGDLVIGCHGPARPRATPAQTPELVAALVTPATRLVGTLNQRRDVRLIVLSSGGAVYGFGDQPFTEAQPLAPVSPYGIAKSAEEMVFGLIDQNRCTATVLRASTVYGRRPGGSTTQGLVDISINRLQHGEPVQLFGQGGAVRGYLQADDLARVIGRIADLEAPLPIYNVCSGERLTGLEVVTAVGAALGVEPDVEFVPFADQTVLVDNTRLLLALGRFEFTSLAEGLVELTSEPSP